MEFLSQLPSWLPWALVFVLLFGGFLFWQSNKIDKQLWIPTIGVLPMIVILLILLLLVWMLNDPQNNSGQENPEYQVGVILVLAIGVLLVLLYIMATGFQGVRLADPKNALGLPEGSIRALIALFLIMSFVIMNIFLFRSVAGRPGGTLQNLTAAEVAALGNRIIDVQTNPITSTITLTNPITGTTTLTNPNQANTFNVTLRSGITPAGEQLALQLATVLGTLVAAVSAFYFGSTTATSASAQGAAAVAGSIPAAPTLDRVFPDTRPPKPAQALAVTGTGFVLGMSMKLARQGEPSITTSDVTVVSPTTITATLDLSNKKPGPWDVVVLNADGSEAARRRDKFQIVVVPEVNEVDPPNSVARADVFLIFLGAGFVSGMNMKLAQGANYIPGANPNVIDSSTLTATFDLTGQVGRWDAVLFDSTDTEVARRTKAFEVV